VKIPGGRPKPPRTLIVADHDPLDEGYAAKLQALTARLQAKGRFQPGTVSVFRIEHDHDCPKLNGGPCRCEADVIEIPADQTEEYLRRRGSKG
jgi:hypothetical protein